jgi:glycosyltransferase involved in cell wall biosynthesis
MLVALLTPVLNDGDAVGNDVLGMARALQRAGHTVQFYAEKTRVSEDVFPIEQVLRGSPDLLIYHHSIQCDAAVAAVEAVRPRAVVKYHNVTPAHYFADFNPDAVRGSEIGRRQAVRLAGLGIPFWTDSAFNGRDLMTDVPGLAWEELPPFHQADGLAESAPDPTDLAGLDDWTTTLLAVGRVAPNKNLELAVETLAAVRASSHPDARLIVAGEHVFPQYSDRVARRAELLGVRDGVIVTGRVSAGQLKALYLSADVLLVTSSHEGFCVPLVEAMALGVPTVGVARTATPDTGGDAVRYAEPIPEDLARAVNELVSDRVVREGFLVAGQRRYAERFQKQAIERRFLELLATVGGGVNAGAGVSS